jgi:hypothetical protein
MHWCRMCKLCSLTSAYIILPPKISKPFSQYTNIIVVYIPHLKVVYWCDHGVGCIILETERSPLLPRGYGTNFQAGWKKLPVSWPSRWALNPISLAVTYHTDSSEICKVSLITSSGFWHYKLSNYYYYLIINYYYYCSIIKYFWYVCRKSILVAEPGHRTFRKKESSHIVLISL